GPASAAPAELTDLDGLLVFSASDGVQGEELWASDGTAAGTVLVADIRSGADGSQPSGLAVRNGILWFSADDGVDGREPWVSDGTAGGTHLVQDVFAGASSNPAELTPSGGQVFFQALEDMTGIELWHTDGTPAGTQLVSDIRPGFLGSGPTELHDLGGALVFSAFADPIGVEPWISDGTTGGTAPLIDLNPGSGGSFPRFFTAFNGGLMFQATDGVTGSELWFTDGTASGTTLVRDIIPGASGGAPRGFVTVGSQLFFSATEVLFGEELWVSDGTGSGTVRVADIRAGFSGSSPADGVALNGIFAFTADDGVNGRELWVSDGTAGGTSLVLDIRPGPLGSDPQDLTVAGGVLYFSADDGTHGRELWVSDGTAAGTFLLGDLQLGLEGSEPRDLFPFGSGLVFSARDDSTGREFWTSDGTPAGTVLLRDIVPGPESSSPSDFATIGGGSVLLFAAGDADHGRELWHSDGTAAKTRRLADIAMGPASSSPGSFVEESGTIVFVADDDVIGRELRALSLSDATCFPTAPPVPTVDPLPMIMGECPLTVGTIPTAMDTCGQQVQGTTTDPLVFTTVGSHTITWTYFDGLQTTQQVQTVQVVDTLPPQPVVAPLPALTVECPFTATPPQASDGCTGVITATTTDPVSFTSTGAFTITWTYFDGFNTTQQVQTVQVQDTTPPVPDISPLPVLSGECPFTVTTNPTATDSCVGAVVGTTLSPLSYSQAGTFLIQWQYSDGVNVSSQSQVVVVSDTTPPVITCPADVTVANDPGVCGAVVTFAAPVATDTCGGAPTVAQTGGPVSGSLFPVGTTAVSFTATDAEGNVANCGLTVTVLDTENPSIACAPSMIVPADPGACGAVVTFPPPTASDNCPGVAATLTAGLPSGSAFPLGTTTETFTAVDAAGNTAVCSFSVTVDDMEAPTIVCPQPVSVVTDTGQCGAIVSYVDPVGSDNCPGVAAQQASGLGSGSLFPIGVTTEVWVATDAAGSVASCSFTVTVTDGEAPVITGCPADITVMNDPGLCTAAVSWTAPVASDNCPGVSLVSDHPSGEDFPVGVTTVTYSASDAAGNTAVCSFTVTVQDGEGPSLGSCPVDVTVPLSPGECQGQATWGPPVLLGDNCPGAFLTSTHAPGDVFPLGTTLVSYVATDAAGNMTTCAFNVTIEGDFEAPVDLGLLGVGSPSPAGPTDVLIADLGSAPGMLLPDGHLDVAVLNATNLEVAIFFNDGAGTLQSPPTVLSLASLGAEPRAFVAGNFDGFGGVDLAIAFRSSDVVGLLTNDGVAWSPGGQIPLFGASQSGGLGRRPVALAVGNLDGGGVDDLVVAMEGQASGLGQGVAVISNLTVISPLTVTGGFRRPRGVVLLDRAGAAQPDLAVIEEASGFSTRNLLLFDADGTGGFTEAASHLDLPANPKRLVAADLDGLGLRDDLAVLSVDQDGGTLDSVVTLFQRSGAGALSAASFLPAISRGILSDGLCLAVGDLRGDTLPSGLMPAVDLVTGSGAADGWEWSGAFDASAQDFQFSGACPGAGPVARVALGDVNGDGLDDVVTVDDVGDVLRVWRSVDRPLADVFGAGCPGSQGVPQISAPVLPALGASVQVDLGQALGGAVAVLGVSGALVPSGVPLCLTYLGSPVLTFSFATSGAGEVVFPFDIPPTPSFVGTELFFQWAVFDPMGGFLNVIALSPGLRMRIGF
ncbi:MAG TPA: HYR domain-containing protein, partial [Planctomycetes bacterium]|nr:HYR domain-containing protein [Planctomycetota bacterium]